MMNAEKRNHFPAEETDLLPERDAPEVCELQEIEAEEAAEETPVGEADGSELSAVGQYLKEAGRYPLLTPEQEQALFAGNALYDDFGILIH